MGRRVIGGRFQHPPYPPFSLPPTSSAPAPPSGAGGGGGAAPDGPAPQQAGAALPRVRTGLCRVPGG
eukprot:9153196-Pyramimonas_sp.AAC.1